MPNPESQSSEPPLPPGYDLDSDTPPLPPGYSLDGAKQKPHLSDEAKQQYERLDKEGVPGTEILNQDWSPRAIGRGVLGGAKAVAQGTYQLGKTIATGSNADLGHLLFDPSKRALDRLREASDKGDRAGIIQHSAELAVPLMGPQFGNVADEEAKGKGPEAGANLGAQYAIPAAAGKVLPRALAAVLPEHVRATLQKGLGVGPRMAEKALEDAGEKFVKQSAEDTAKQQSAHAANEEVWQKAKNEQLRAAKAAQEQARTLAKRKELQAKIDSGLKEVEARRVKAQETAKTVLDQNWKTVREKTAGETENPDRLVSAVKNVEENVLKGSPENIKQFRDILSLQEEGSEAEAQASLAEFLKNNPQVKLAGSRAAPPSEVTPVTFDKLHGWYSELGHKMYRGGYLQGDVLQALKQVRNKLGEMMDDMATRKGAMEDLTGARKMTAKYQDTFGRPTSKPLSSSEKGVRALDPKAFAERAMQQHVGRVGEFDPEFPSKVGEIRSAQKALKELPAEKTLQPGEQEVPEGRLKPIPEKRPAEGVNIENERLNRVKDKIASLSSMSQLDARTFGLTDIPKATMMWVLDRPSFLEWIKQPTAKDFAILSKLPPEVQAATAKLIKNATLAESKQLGKTPTPSPHMARFLMLGAQTQQ